MNADISSVDSPILVLDANERSALAVTRSLGRAGYTVLVAADRPNSLAGASRYSSGELQYPSPYQSPQAFLEWFTRQCRKRAFRAAVPVTEVTTDLLARHRSAWPAEVSIPCAHIEAIDGLSDKVLLFKRALELGVPVPESVVVASRDDLDLAIRKIGFPAFLKPRRSRLWIDNAFVSASVHRVESVSELRRLYELPQFSREPFLYQQPVAGNGCGVFALFDHGRPITFFSHRRIREKPPEGGVSVLSESCDVDETLRDYSARLLHAVNWHGVAMVEFKGSGHNARLMEVNARFWGSLQLAIDAGVDFPALLLNSTLRSASETLPEAYRRGVRLRWLLGDIDRLYIVLKNKGPWMAKVHEVLEFFVPDPFRTRHEVFRWNDPLPALREAIQYTKG
jgi:predicted ATP-grasp superfamily ATP-dependent carboligase